MQTVGVYVILLIANLSMSVTVHLLLRKDDVRVCSRKSSKLVDRLSTCGYNRIINLYQRHRAILTVLSLIPLVSIGIIILAVRRHRETGLAELVLDYAKDDWKIEIYECEQVNFAIINGNYTYKALITNEALDYLLELSDAKIKFYLSVFKVCISEAMQENKYKIIMTLGTKGLSFEKINYSK